MRKSILNFPMQFLFKPEIENLGKLNMQRFSRFIVAGMGGSHLSGDLVGAWKPELNIAIHSDYGLSSINRAEQRSTLVIASSYSGNTEETIDAFKTALRRKIQVVAIATGGNLLELAKKHCVPYIKLPDTEIQPRMATGLGFRALLKILGEENALRESMKLATFLKAPKIENKGRVLAKKLKGYVPIIYSSTKNSAIAYNWKIKFNETGKIPAFYNVLPELNHNEMTGFSAGGGLAHAGTAEGPGSGGKKSTQKLSRGFYFIFFRDAEDHPRILKRMSVLKRLYNDRGLRVEMIDINGQTRLQRIFLSLILADWTAYYTALGYGVDPEQVPMVEEFKKLIVQ